MKHWVNNYQSGIEPKLNVLPLLEFRFNSSALVSITLYVTVCEDKAKTLKGIVSDSPIKYNMRICNIYMCKLVACYVCFYFFST